MMLMVAQQGAITEPVMRKIVRAVGHMKTVFADQGGAGAVEYGGLLVAGIIATVAINTGMKTQITSIFSTLTTKVAAIK
ncbi:MULTISPECIES: hypothetical protein [unclassified Xanthobacter]|uniref:hypothetical protein n=1 Tax=unclassified Xanthobacter TaxID=2623496 RepID=UPI001F472334|nr:MULTISPECIES: hypothetical protein [unclassified Xanthobacter]